jgi:hypothetical protein
MEALHHVNLHHHRFHIHEVPITTFYGDEMGYLNGFRSAPAIGRRGGEHERRGSA